MLKRYLIIGVLVLLCIGLISLVISEKRENKRLKSNQHELLLQTDIFKSELDKKKDDVKQLELSINELKTARAELLEKVEQQGIKIKKLQSLNTTAYEVKTIINTIIKDSIVIRDSIPTIINKVSWNDGYTFLNGTIENKTLTAEAIYRDTLIQTIYPVYKKFIFRCRLWGVKEIRQKAFFSNPNAEIKFQEVIKIKK